MAPARLNDVSFERGLAIYRMACRNALDIKLLESLHGTRPDIGVCQEDQKIPGLKDLAPEEQKVVFG